MKLTHTKKRSLRWMLLSFSFKFKIQQYRLVLSLSLPFFIVNVPNNFIIIKLIRNLHAVYEYDYNFERVSMHEMKTDRICGSSAFHAQTQTHLPIMIRSESCSNIVWD